MTVEPQPLRRSKGFRIMVFGVPGAGKTFFAGTGARTLIIRPPTDAIDAIPTDADVTEIVVQDHNDFLDAFQYLQQGGYKNHDVAWLDSISLFQDHGLDDVFQAAIDRKAERAEYGPDKGEYGINMGRLGKWCRDMTGLADAGLINFGITAHPFEWFDPVQKEEVWAPFIQGKNMSPKICGYMNIVAYLMEKKGEEGEPSRRVLMTDAPGFYGKDQFNCFPELKSGRHGILDPTMPKVVSAIKKARGGQPARRPRKKVKRPNR